MQEHLAPIVRSQDNLAFTVIVTGCHQFYRDEEYRLADIWPRGMNVDVAGFDIYNQLGVVKDGEVNTTGTDLDASYLADRALETPAQRGVGAGGTGFTHAAARPTRTGSGAPTDSARTPVGGVHVLQHDAEQHRPVGPVHVGQAAGWREAQTVAASSPLSLPGWPGLSPWYAGPLGDQTSC